jgi:hypothetical protein
MTTARIARTLFGAFTVARRSGSGTVTAVPPLPTGFPTSDAKDDFSRARRGNALAEVASRLRGQAGDVNLILPFEEVVAAVGRVGERDVGLQVIPLDSIVGTVDRTAEFDRQFRPTSARMRRRWERIADAKRRGESMPPISVYRIGEVHFVRDGHHRVSVARAQGQKEIDAYVTEVLTRVGAARDITLGDLPLKSNERLFHERVPLPSDARARISLSDSWDYLSLAEGVEAWGFRDMQARDEFVDRPDVARAWFEREYVPVIEMLREADLLGDVTETDAYVDIASERYRLLRTHEWSEDVIRRIREARRGRGRLRRG